jgi:CTP-dependent riboflavin kinase
MARIETLIMHFDDNADLSELMQSHCEGKQIMGGVIRGIGSGDYFAKLEECEEKLYQAEEKYKKLQAKLTKLAK